MELKFTIILGVATDIDLMKDLLPYEALSLLDMRHFSCLPAPKYLQEFLNCQLMTTDAPFQIGPQLRIKIRPTNDPKYPPSI